MWAKDEQRARILQSIKAEHPKLSAADARKASRWVGADKSISGKLKPGSKKWYAAKAAEQKLKAEALAKAKAAAEAQAMAAKMLHSQKVKVGLLKKKYELPDEGLTTLPPGATAPVPAELTTAGLDDLLAKKGVTIATAEDKAVVLKAVAAHPATPKLAAQLDEFDALVLRLRAKQTEAKVVAKKEAHALKVKAGLTRKKYGVKKDWTFEPGGAGQPALSSEGAKAWAKQRGLDEFTTDDWLWVVERWKVLDAPGKPLLQAQMEAMEELAQYKLAHRKVVGKATEDALAAVKKWGGQVPAPAQVLDGADYGHLPGWAQATGKKTQSYGVIIFDDQGRVLLREPKDHYGGAHWTFAKGGGTKPGTTAVAELAEETGHKVNIYGMIEEGFEGSTTKTNYFLGRSAGFDAGLMDLETAATKWMTYDEAIEAIAKSTDPIVVTRDTKVLKAAYAALGDPDAQAAFAAVKKSGIEAFQETKAAAAKAAHSHKVKLGMAQKHFAKPKFGGGVVDADWVNPATKQKLNRDGLNKVLSEKGWHTTTLPQNVKDALYAADDVVGQKAVVDEIGKNALGLKQAKLKKLEEDLKKAFPDTPTGEPTGFDEVKLHKFLQKTADELGFGATPEEVQDALFDIMGTKGYTAQLKKLEDKIGYVPEKAELDRLVTFKAPTAAADDVPTTVADVPTKYIGTGDKLNGEGIKHYTGVGLSDIQHSTWDALAGAKDVDEQLAIIKAWKAGKVVDDVPTPTAPLGEPVGFDQAKLYDYLKKVGEDIGVDAEDVEASVQYILKGKNYAAQVRAMEAQLGYVPEEDLAGLVKYAADVPATPAAPPGFAVPLEGELKKIKDLPGSTKPYLAEDAAGKKWVVKDVSGSGIDPDHLRSEALADRLYRIMGHDTPLGSLVDSPGGPMKVTEFLEGGQTLAEWKVGKSAKAIREMHEQLRKGFVADALLANHDVAGMANDNIFIVAGKAYRIDNGGALTYRAQGGAKRTWGPKVAELKTMRDASTNANTAAIYKGITDEEIEQQIRAIVAKRSQILQAIPDDGVRATMAARLDDLAAKLPPTPTRAAVPGRGAPAGVRRAAYTPDAQAAERAKAARSNGLSIASDRDHIEDTNMLVWQELDDAGKPQLRMQFKVTQKGSDSIVEALGDELKKARATAAPTAARNSNVHPDDTYWPTVLKAVKTVNHHAGDKAYNAATLEELAQAKAKVTTALKKATGDTKKMLQHYADAIAEVEKAKAAGTTTPKLGQYVHKPKPVKAPPKPVEPTRSIRVRRGSGIDFRTMDYKKGQAATRAAGRNHFGTAESYVIDADEGVTVKFIPNDGSFAGANGRALHGTVTVTMPGEVTEEAIRKAMGVLEDIGVHASAPPTPAFEEALYLHRGVYINKKHTLASYRQIWEDATLTDEQRVVKLKGWVKKNMGIDVEKVPHYDPAGVARHADGSGFRQWERWDLGAEQVAKEMDGYSIFHSTGSLSDSPKGRVATTLERVLDSDGEFTSTTGRIRKGVDVRATGGASYSSDIDTGGASYFFTRIKKDTSGSHGFYFRVGTLSRQDAISYSGDNFGRISNIGNRASKVSEYKQFASYSSNETIFKEGLSLDDLDFIRVHDKAEVAEVVKVFHDRGIYTLPDGRKVEDIVVTTSGKPKARRVGK